MNEILLSLSGASNDCLPFRMRPVVENIASTGTDAEDMDKYCSASLLSTGNQLECCCPKANGSVSELAHFICVVCHFHGNVS